MRDNSPYYPPEMDTPRLPRRDLNDGCDCCHAYGDFRRADKEDNLGNILCRRCYDGACTHGHVHTATAVTRGGWAEYCECGAVRLLDRAHNHYEEWHVCDLCRVPGAPA